MESNTTTTPTIAELWAEFEEHLVSISLEEKIGRSAEGSTLNSFHDYAVLRIPILRAQLLEICGRVCSMIFYVDGKNLHIEFKNSDWIADADDLERISAATAFWKWELEHREKEK